jgi:WD40 repeat protein
MFQRSFVRNILALLMLAACSPHAYCQISGQETSTHVEFRYERGDGKPADAKETLSPDKSVVVRVIRASSKSKRDVRLFDAAKGTALGPTIELKAHRVTALAVSSDNCTVATAIGNHSNDWGEVRVWNAKTGKEIARYKAAGDETSPYLGEVSRLSFSEDGKTVTIVSGPAGGR